ncbi:UNVERIFIED_CONTAM: hypothetical protein NO986_00550 [Comamonas sp. A-3]|nr:hypothetical protein [Comamonas thiooxydans]
MATELLSDNKSNDAEENSSGNNKKINIPTPRWKVWKQSGSCRIWLAVLLTLNIEPPPFTSKRLKEFLPKDIYQEFKDRRSIVIRQYGVHPLLPSIEHHAQGNKNGERIVSLNDLLAFGKAQGWAEIEHMEAGLGNSSSPPTEGGVSLTHRLEPEIMPKGERYTLVRMGALLEVLEKWIAAGGKIPASCIQSGGLNFSELERQAISIIKARALNKSYSGFNQGVFRREYATAKHMLDDRFPKSSAAK